MDLEMDKEAGPYHSQQLYHSHLLWFKLSHSQFKLTLVRDLIQEAGRVSQPQTARQRRPAPPTSQLKTLDLRHNRHWLMYCKRIRCCVCSAKHKTRTTNKYPECNKRVCATPYFKVYHTKLHF